MKFPKILMGALAASFLFVSTPASADYIPETTPAQADERGVDLMVEYLSIEQFTPSRLEFRKLSSDPAADLITVAQRRSYPVSLRARAIQSLPLYKADERAADAIDSLMTSFQPGQKLFGPTLVSYASMHGESVTEAISPYAEHPNPEVRMAAVIALGRFCGQAGYDMLTNLVHDEEDSDVLARIRKYVG